MTAAWVILPTYEERENLETVVGPARPRKRVLRAQAGQSQLSVSSLGNRSDWSGEREQLLGGTRDAPGFSDRLRLS